MICPKKVPKVGLESTRPKASDFESLNELTPQEVHARNVWLFSFYLVEIRAADVLLVRWSDVYDGRLHYRMNKNEKLLLLKFLEKICPILKAHKTEKENTGDFVFPEMKKSDLKNPKDILAKTKTANKKFNKYLESIAKKPRLTKGLLCI